MEIEVLSMFEDDLPILETTRNPYPSRIGPLFSVEGSQGETPSSLQMKFYLLGIYAGFGSLSVDYPERTMEWETFFPYQYITKLEKRGLGLGTIAHVEFLRHIMETENVDDYLVTHNMENASNSRKHQLKKMKIDSPLVLLEYFAKSVNFAMGKGFYSKEHFEAIKSAFYQK